MGNDIIGLNCLEPRFDFHVKINRIAECASTAFFFLAKYPVFEHFFLLSLAGWLKFDSLAISIIM